MRALDENMPPTQLALINLRQDSSSCTKAEAGFQGAFVDVRAAPKPLDTAGFQLSYMRGS